MIAQAIPGHVSQSSWNKTTTKQKCFTWYESSGEIFYDGALIIKIIIDMCTPETKVGVQSLRVKISETKSESFRNNMPGMLEHVKKTMDVIEAMGKTHENILKDAFDALLTAPNTRFNQIFSHGKLLWEAGKHYDFDMLNSIAKSLQ